MLPPRPGAARPRRASKQRLLAVLAALATAAFAAPLAAQPGIPLTLAEAQRLAQERSPQLASQKSMAEASREMAAAAGQLPDPQVFAGIENVPVSGMDKWSLRDGMTMTRIGFMQEFPREEKRRLRSERALREAERAEVVAEGDALAVRRETATAWLNAAFAQRVERAIAAQIAEVELQATMAGASYRAGRGAQNDVLAAQQALIELRNRTVEAQLATRRARLALARYVGDAAERPLEGMPELGALPQNVDALVQVDAQPDVRRLDAQAAVLDTEAQLARAMRKPDWSLELSYGIRANDNPDMVSLMVRMELPWSPGSRQDREWAAKLKERDATTAMREDARRMREAEVRQMLAEWNAMREQAQRLRDELIPLSRARTDAALASYRGGMGPLAMVLEARRGELEADVMLINMELAAARAWAWLANLVPGSAP
ncbi:MAG TPA: TolC family protein [Casimicrobiaceae bacterium]|nr:TolC family protein [Casimicrobiaceae bacterium]